MIGHKIVSTRETLIAGKLVKFEKETDIHELKFYAVIKGQNGKPRAMIHARGQSLRDALIEMTRLIKHLDIISVDNPYK